MFKDRTVVWVMEYIVGGALVIVPLLIGLGLQWAAWTDAHIWAVGLFVICLGVILISCASSMRQRILLARRIDTLDKRMADGSASSQESATESQTSENQ